MGDMWVGRCVGGPLDGLEGQSRFPEGFLLVNKQVGRVWIYDWDEVTGLFQVREPGGRVVDHAKRFAAADDVRFDVRAPA